MLEIEKANIVVDEIAVFTAKPFVVVGIPAFNEEETIAKVVFEAQQFSDAVVVCDDGSSDMTGIVAERWGADVIRHERNLGYGASIKSLFQRAHVLNCDILVTLDGDGQHNPQEIPNLVKPIIKSKADMVIGSRFIEKRGTKEMPTYRKIGAQFITRLVNGSSKNGISDAQSGFRAYSREAIDRLSPIENGMGASVEILLRASKHDLKICEVPSSCRYCNGDKPTSTEHPIPHGFRIIMSIIRFFVKDKPLKLLGASGLLSLIINLGFSVWMLQIYAVSNQIGTNISSILTKFV